MTKKRYVVTYADGPIARELGDTAPPAQLFHEVFDTIDEALDWIDSKDNASSFHGPMISDTEEDRIYDWYKVRSLIKKRKGGGAPESQETE